MTGGALTVGTTATLVPYSQHASLGMKLLARDGNSGNVYMGFNSSVTTSTGILVPQGTPDASFPKVVPPAHFAAGGTVYLIADAAAQTVDWEAQ